MTKKISLREALAWLTLVIAFILFGISLTFAQTKTINVTNENGKVHVIITKSENGKAVNIDTVFAFKGEEELDRMINDLAESLDIKIVHDSSNDGSEKDKKVKRKIIIERDVDDKKEWKGELEKEVEISKKEFHRALRELQYDLDRLKESVHKEFHNIEREEMEDMNVHDLDDAVIIHKIEFRDYLDDIPELEGIDKEENIIVLGKAGEKAPVPEKTITLKDGRQAYVFKRLYDKDIVNDEKEMNNNETGDLKDLKVFPNPSNGKFSISFTSLLSEDIKIEVLDQNNRVIYKEKLNDFKGEYSKELNLSKSAKGNYILKITQGKNNYNRKLILN